MWAQHDEKSTTSSAVKNMSLYGKRSKIISRRLCLDFFPGARKACEPEGPKDQLL